MKSFFSYSLCFFLFVLLTGCQGNKGEFVPKSEAELEQMEEKSQQANTFFVGDQLQQAEKIIKKLVKEKTVSQPLYMLEHLSVLLMKNNHTEALQLMEKIHRDFEMLFDRKLAEKAQSVWHGEVNKVFKGDSYERATFYAFMALSYIQQGKYEDAVRCVKNGLLADADSNNEKAINDYALLHYIGFLASKKMGQEDEALEYLRGMSEALKIRGCTDQQLLDSLVKGQNAHFDKLKPNVLLCVWTGAPPTVVRLGRYKEQRSIVHGKMLFDSMALAVGTRDYVPFMNNLGDIDFQATTRGGRLMDNILADKAAAKAAMDGMHSALTAAGLCGAGTGFIILGFTFHIIGSYMNPEADGRYWKNLPGELYLVPLRLPPGKHRLMLTGFKNSDRAGSALYDIEVSPQTAVNVIHLPMMRQGLAYSSIFVRKFQEEQQNVRTKAASQRMEKEIK